ncbi:MAG: hypothetical protein PHW74_05570 [Desulfobacca sp.]|nr:hypothetical protein [Desulfobacca sp.]
MKIEDLLALGQTISRPEPQSRAEQGENFADILQAAQEKTNPSTVATSSGILPPAAPLEIISNSSVSADSLKVLEDGLSRLEAYQQGLSSGEVSLKSLAPLATALEQDSRRLQDLAAQLPPDSPLKSVAEEVGALSWVESFKFQRGDYV